MFKVYIIAEIGVNHNGKIDLAKESIRKAKEIGADAVKFQLFKAENLVTKVAPKAFYQQKNMPVFETQYEMLKNLELNIQQMNELKDYSSSLGIDFICSPFDNESAKELNSIGVETFKLGSGEITNIPLLELINTFGKKLILSTGMSNYAEVEEALKYLSNTDVILMHCTSNYPTDMHDVNLNAMRNLGRAFDKKFGYSDHTLGNEAAIGATVLGAQIIEKHFTLDKKLTGPDHKASLSPDEFKKFITSIRNIELAMGDGIKKCLKSEEDTKKSARKSLHINREVDKNEIIEFENLVIKRPGDGIHPRYLNKIIGMRAKNILKIDHQLQWEDLI